MQLKSNKTILCFNQIASIDDTNDNLLWTQLRSDNYDNIRDGNK